MWNITSDDIQRAKDQIELRRAEVEARYAEEKKALEAEIAGIETLERAAAEFTLKHHRDDAGITPKTVAPAEAASDGGEGKPHSRWRLQLGNRPADADGVDGNGVPAAR
jgi:DNA-binding helix-hairpin-helix protein with protein kinase domain